MAGVLMPIGGAEDKTRPAPVLARFLALAGGVAARIVVISTASSLGDVITAVYLRLFDRLGAAEAIGMRPESRAEADHPRLAGQVAEATGVFLTGGNQMKLSTVLGGTRLGEAIAAAHARGAVVGGTSAGASALSRHMVSFGAEGATPKQRMSQLSAGLGLIDGVVIDQHFSQRNRIGRLLSLVAASPELLGVGIDEDTAAVIDPDGVAEVIGRGAVTVVDGRHVVSGAATAKRTAPLLVSGAVLHILPEGCRFDLRARRLLAAPGQEVPAAGGPTPRLLTVADVPSTLGQRSRQIAAEGAFGGSYHPGGRHRPRRHAGSSGHPDFPQWTDEEASE
jgi:cyanophycinase